MKGLIARSLYKKFSSAGPHVLKNINLDIPEGSFCSITGRSGSGKSTLLYILSTLDTPSTGEILINGTNVHQLSIEKQHLFRNENMGFVFQFHHLLPELTALENILLPALKANQFKEKKLFGLELLKRVGLSDKANRQPTQLSGGEQQRVAIARALIMKPQYIFADEPTGNLDSTNGEAIMNLFKEFNQDFKTTVIYVTHDELWAQMSKTRIIIVDGEIQ